MGTRKACCGGAVKFEEKEADEKVFEVHQRRDHRASTEFSQE